MQAYMEVRRGARQGDNKGESKKATWYQNDKGKAKTYQVKQVLLAIERLEVNYGPEK